MTMHKYLLLLSLSWAAQLSAQSITRFQPTHEQMVERYRRAEHIDDITRNAVFKTTVEPHWSADGESFWYCNILKDSAREYFRVQAATGKKEKIDGPGPESAPTAGPRTRGNGNAGRFGNFRGGATSPDKQWEAYLQNGNLYVKPTNGNATPIQFTTDGTDSNPYGAFTWSPDSKYIAGYHIHPVKDSNVYAVLTSVPGTTRGQLRARPYKQPGDPFTSYELYLFPIDAKKAVKVNAETIDFPANAPILHWRYDNPRFFTYEKFDRGHQRLRVIEVDATTAQTRNVVDEKTKTFIYLDRQLMFYPQGTNFLIRSSEKDGWRHIYLVDLATGAEQAITKGNWVVRGVDSIDMTKKEVWFSASGMNPGEDPYLIHYYRIKLNGTNLFSLTPEAGNHKLTFSPNSKYFIDNYSQVNVAPITKLRRTSDGKELSLLETADLSYYKTTGVNPPEVFVAKARDGVTDIWGIVHRPSDYDPTKKYPVLENIYAGPHDSFVPKSFVPYSEMQSLAELGFIVVMIDGMGTANRSKAFHDVCWQNIADAGFPDRILWIKALAQKYPYVDAERVGIYGTSAGGQNSTGALLFHPDFYKAAVSACGCHDNRVDKQWWNEQWMGYPVAKHYEDQSNVTNAYKLKGSLMLIVGEADTNVPPESTYRVADALIKAGKAFDFLSIPGMDHSDGGPYGRIKKRNFFVQHLMGILPPDINSGELPFKKDIGRERWSFL
ncbi:MAG: prolyl oligopeptidase family serine peptidase [Bacteroidetes bacterium]|nr:prolyl oligopeptidase family serine peptidase [Bacteroidota bacterium]